MRVGYGSGSLPLAYLLVEDAMVCRQCGATLSPDAKFCPSCGQARGSNDDVAVSITSPSVDQALMQTLRKQITDSLEKARAQQRIIKGRSTKYSMTTIILSGFGTFVAGIATILNQPFADDWRLTCGIAAVLGLATTIVAGLQQTQASADLLTEVNASVARLRALQIETSTLNFNVAAVQQQYQQIVTESARIDL